MSQNPVVSIICFAYNHEKYIKNALDGFAMQKTSFPFEVIVHDDASTDKTAEIVREYESKYPDIFRPIYQNVNQYSLGKGRVSKICYEAVTGKYIAMCEGDDYWIDPLKLQKQVDFLEGNPEYSFSMGSVLLYDEQKKKTLKVAKYINNSDKEEYQLEDYLRKPFSQTSSFLFRQETNIMPKWFFEVHAGDQSLVVINAKNGKIKYHKDLFSVYRRNVNSISHISSAVRTFTLFDKTLQVWDDYTEHRYTDILLARRLLNLMELQSVKIENKVARKGYRLLMKVVKSYQDKISK